MLKISPGFLENIEARPFLEVGSLVRIQTASCPEETEVSNSESPLDKLDLQVAYMFILGFQIPQTLETQESLHHGSLISVLLLRFLFYNMQFSRIATAT
jgi:hypothetical protein